MKHIKYDLDTCMDIFDWFDAAEFDYLNHILLSKLDGDERVRRALPEIRKRAGPADHAFLKHSAVEDHRMRNAHDGSCYSAVLHISIGIFRAEHIAEEVVREARIFQREALFPAIADAAGERWISLFNHDLNPLFAPYIPHL